MILWVSEAAWAIPFKRIAEGITSYFLIGGIIMLFIIIAGKLHWNHIWHWMVDWFWFPVFLFNNGTLYGLSR